MITLEKSRFLRSPWTLVIIAVRVLIVFVDLQKRSWPLMLSPGIRSAVVRPHETLDSIRRWQQLGTVVSRRENDFNRKPLVVAFISALLDQTSNMGAGIIPSILLLLADLLVACILERIGVLLLGREEGDDEQRLQEQMPEVIRPRTNVFAVRLDCEDALVRQRDMPMLAACCYFCTPVAILGSGVYESYQCVVYACFLWSIYVSMRPGGNLPLGSLGLVIATYEEPFLAVFIIPLALGFMRQGVSIQVSAGFVLLWGSFMGLLSYLMVGDDYLRVSFSFPFFQHPNLGLQWYFQMQVFDRFRNYFALMFAGLKYVLVVPLTLRLHRYPLVLTTALWFVFILFHSEPTLLDFNICMCLLLLSPRSLARMRILSLVAMCALPVPLTLYVMDSWLWLGPASGNANFIFFQSLAFDAFVAILFLEFCSASVARDKAVRLARKIV